MITVNNCSIEFHEGITVMRLLEQLKKIDKFNRLINGTTTVIINKKIITVSDYNSRIINNEDIIFIYPALAGG
ncbi:MAG: MoaD/ThiS family protein [Syntrophomonas sp.]